MRAVRWVGGWAACSPRRRPRAAHFLARRRSLGGWLRLVRRRRVRKCAGLRPPTGRTSSPHSRKKHIPSPPLHRPSRDPHSSVDFATPRHHRAGFGYSPRHPLLILVSLPTQTRHFSPMSVLGRPTNQDQQLSSRRVGRARRRDPISPSCHRLGVECGTKACTRRRVVDKVPHSTTSTPANDSGNRTNRAQN